MTELFTEVAPIRSTTAKDLEAMLRAMYLPESKPDSGIFATEIQDPTGRRRADVLWAPQVSSGRGRLICHEIKVSRADVMTELSDPTKADAWLQFCNQFWLVIPDKALVAGLTIPDAWGIMTPPSGRNRRRMTVVKYAAELKPIDPAPALATLTAWMFYRFAEQRHEIAVLGSKVASAESVAERYRDEVRSLEEIINAGGEHPFHWVRDLLSHLTALTGGKELDWNTRPEAKEVAEVLADLKAARRTAKDIRRTFAAADRDLEHLATRIATARERAQKNTPTPALAEGASE